MEAAGTESWENVDFRQMVDYVIESSVKYDGDSDAYVSSGSRYLEEVNGEIGRISGKDYEILAVASDVNKFLCKVRIEQEMELILHEGKSRIYKLLEEVGAKKSGKTRMTAHEIVDVDSSEAYDIYMEKIEIPRKATREDRAELARKAIIGKLDRKKISFINELAGKVKAYLVSLGSQDIVDFFSNYVDVVGGTGSNVDFERTEDGSHRLVGFEKGEKDHKWKFGKSLRYARDELGVENYGFQTIAFGDGDTDRKMVMESATPLMAYVIGREKTGSERLEDIALSIYKGSEEKADTWVKFMEEKYGEFPVRPLVKRIVLEKGPEI